MIIFISAFWVLVSSSAVVTSLGGGTLTCLSDVSARQSGDSFPQASSPLFSPSFLLLLLFLSLLCSPGRSHLCRQRAETKSSSSRRRTPDSVFCPQTGRKRSSRPPFISLSLSGLNVSRPLSPVFMELQVRNFSLTVTPPPLTWQLKRKPGSSPVWPV